MIYPVKEWKQYNFQLVQDILIIHMEVILWVGEVSIDLQKLNQQFRENGSNTKYKVFEKKHKVQGLLEDPYVALHEF
jgi:hypothetical protein